MVFWSATYEQSTFLFSFSVFLGRVSSFTSASGRYGFVVVVVVVAVIVVFNLKQELLLAFSNLNLNI